MCFYNMINVHTIIWHKNTHLVRPKPRIVQLLDRILHVLVPQKLHHPRTVFVRVGKAHVARLAHVILQVLPRSRRRQSGHQHTELRSLRHRATIAASLAAAATVAIAAAALATAAAAAAPNAAATAAAEAAAAAAAVAARTAATRKLDAQPIAIVVVAVARLHRILGITGVVNCIYIYRYYY